MVMNEFLEYYLASLVSEAVRTVIDKYKVTIIEDYGSIVELTT